MIPGSSVQATVVECACMVELKALNGREKCIKAGAESVSEAQGAKDEAVRMFAWTLFRGAQIDRKWMNKGKLCKMNWHILWLNIIFIPIHIPLNMAWLIPSCYQLLVAARWGFISEVQLGGTLPMVRPQNISTYHEMHELYSNTLCNISHLQYWIHTPLLVEGHNIKSHLVFFKPRTC